MPTGTASTSRHEPAHAPPPVSVLQISATSVYSRFGRMFRQLGLALADEGVRVSFLSDAAQLSDDLDGTAVHDLPYPSLRGWHGWRLSAWLERLRPQPDVVHLWGTETLRAVQAWALRAQRPLLVHATSPADADRLSRHSPRPGQRVAVMYAALREGLAESHGEASDVLAPALLGPDAGSDPRPPDRTLGIVVAGERVSGEAGRVLLDAIARLRRGGHDLQTALIGAPADLHGFWREVRDRGVRDCVSLIAEPAMWDQAMHGADVCVIPGCERAVSLAPLLAMALGKVVIASRDQLADWFLEDETTLMFAPDSPVELAYQIAQVMNRHPTAMALGRAAADYVGRRHAVGDLAARLALVYRTMLEPGGGAAPVGPGESWKHG